MSSYYSSNPKFYVGIDCIIFGFNEGELNLLLLKRNFEPAMGNWSLMGGFVQESESVDDAAKRVLAELTGLDNVYMGRLCRSYRPRSGRTGYLHCLLCVGQHQ